MKQRADALLGEMINSVVTGRPVLFSQEARQDQLAQRRVERAARQAGFDDVAFLFEPIGAALTYEANLMREERACVLDFWRRYIGLECDSPWASAPTEDGAARGCVALTTLVAG
jgi:hypothetical protein